MIKEDIKVGEYIIPTTAVEKSFKAHISQFEGKSARIFFSGKYGVGKTQFLKKFFEAQQDDYLKIHLYPVNYQIYSNIDIIELLKADIIIELLRQNITFDNNFKLTLVEYLKQYTTPSLIAEKIFDYGADISKTISSTIPSNPLYSIPTGVFSFLGKALKDYQAVNTHFQDIKSGNVGIIEKFLKESEEPDIISSIIHKTIKGIDSKKSVLIIDDLDRLDPEHIFRILNILSAHFDQGREQDGHNKFGFDYIIMVGDYHNIQNIFYHKYGKEIDFDGYMDKFYTLKPFEFDNKKDLLEDLGRLLGEYQREDYKDNPDAFTFGMVDDILRKSIDLDTINLRALLKNQSYKLLSLHQKQSDLPEEDVRVSINRAIDILIDIFGTKEKFIEIIQRVKLSQLPTPLITYNNGSTYRNIIGYLYDPIQRFVHKPTDRFTFKSPHSSLEYFVLLDKDGGVPNASIQEGMGNISYHHLYYDLLSEYISQNKHT